MTTTPAPKGADIEQAERALKCGEEFAYDTPGPAKDWAHAAARGILYDLSDRRGIKHGFRDVAADVRDEITASLADIIRAAVMSSTSTSQGAARPKDHNIRQLVNDLRAIAEKFHAHGCLRDTISRAVGQFIDDSYGKGGNSGAAPGDALDAATITVIRSSIADYYRALNARQHGELAMDRSFRAIERELGMSWDMWTRAELSAIAASTSKGEEK